MSKTTFNLILRVLATGSVLCLLACSTPDTPPSAALETFTPRQPDAHQHIYATPEQAVDALVLATRTNQKSALLTILGSHANKLIYSGDIVADARGQERFLAAYDKMHKIESDKNGQDLLIVGDEEWPLPIPLVRADKGWWFDTTQGEEEILNRRIGHNELNVIKVCQAYVDAQQDFAESHPIGTDQHEYAETFQSTKGKHNGLYWPSAKGEPQSPFGPLIAKATAKGYSEKTLSTHTPYQGYFYKILKQQGPSASGGAQNYVVNGHMTRGYALVAFPARYGDSGVMTFIVNQQGIIYEKNLGHSTMTIARQMTKFDPDDSWSVVRQ